MSRRVLTDRMVKQAKMPGVLVDGGGLRLRIIANAKTGELRKSWVLRTKVKGGPVREIGLGSAETLALADARDKGRTMRAMAREGVDPLVHRDAERGEDCAGGKGDDV
jgi:hypothetical protein